MRQLWQL